MTPPGIDPGNVQLVAQCFNHYATQGPEYGSSYYIFVKFVGPCSTMLNNAQQAVLLSVDSAMCKSSAALGPSHFLGAFLCIIHVADLPTNYYFL